MGGVVVNMSASLFCGLGFNLGSGLPLWSLYVFLFPEIFMVCSLMPLKLSIDVNMSVNGWDRLQLPNDK